MLEKGWLWRWVPAASWVFAIACADNKRAEFAGQTAKPVPPCEQVIAKAQAREKSGLDKRAFPDATAIWRSTRIPVCWEKPNLADPLQTERRERVRAAVVRTWEAASKVRFLGWGACKPTADGIRIQIEDTAQGSHTRGLGSRLNKQPGGMVLNFTMKQWTPKCGTGDACFDQVAIHEFGHALGFAHEQNRPDGDPECRETFQGQSGTCTFCKTDEQSIMSYCRDDWSNTGELSSCDEYSVAALYGKP